jgi:hypothetical protein
MSRSIITAITQKKRIRIAYSYIIVEKLITLVKMPPLIILENVTKGLTTKITFSSPA